MNFILLEKSIKSYYPKAENLDLVKKAFEFSKESHKGYKRLSGEDFFIHPFNVAFLLSKWHLDLVSISAGLLHDVIEDTDKTKEDLLKNFPHAVVNIVNGVTNIKEIEDQPRIFRKMENMRKMILSMFKDLRVVFVKLADVLDNLRTLEFLDEERRVRFARESMEVYAPLAHRFGMSEVKGEMEDLSFKYLYPDEYKILKEKIDKSIPSANMIIQNIEEELKALLNKNNIKAKVKGRIKRIYSVFRKIKTQKRDFDEIYDLIGIRIITETIKECYIVLGILHREYTPLMEHFYDYIASPKMNMYRSIHTKIYNKSGGILEVQIRTEEMDKEAELGIAAHWRYKEEDYSKEIDKWDWLKNLYEWQNEKISPEEFFRNLKIDLYYDEIFVFTPKGEVKVLPKGSTVLDFAYLIHTDIGNHARLCKVNGKVVPFEYQLKNKDKVEIVVAKNSHPSPDWLKIVKTPQARYKIRKYLKNLN